MDSTDEIRVAIRKSSIGLILVAHGRKGVVAVMIGDDRNALRSDMRIRFPLVSLVDGDSESDAIAARIIEFIESPSRALELPLDMRGSDFQREVWRALRAIPPGRTATYAEVARSLGRPSAVRAVAAACAANPLAVVVPCHRVVRSDGGLAGYRWGIDRKRALLAREATA
ncbi:MAG: methylated-DNA--[protein]-cysteine S-methyltransferase [Gemmatimonadaceae bacterium]|nr:methylated-DNA--[protein]-cysteine S-methyltransferase [Gemmatimonadaceae bacterium]